MRAGWRRSTKILLVLGIYLIGLFLGVFVVGLVPVLRHRSFLVFLAQEAAESHNAGQWMEDNVHPNILFMVYDAEGNLLQKTDPPNGQMDVDFDPWVERSLDTAMSSDSLFFLRVVRNGEAENRRTAIITFLGVPLSQDGETTGAVFLARNLVDLPTTIACFAALYPGLFLAAVLCISLVKRRERELEQLRRDYIANISHELKTPISSIKAITETLGDGLAKDQQTQSRYYGIILSETNRLEHGIKSMLELSKMQSRKMHYGKARVSATALFGPVCDKFQVLCDDMGIFFSVSDEVFQLPELYTNAELITQLLEIILDNAVKFVREDGEINVRAVPAGKRVTICVRDNGVGIEKADLPRVFERFYTGNRAYNESGNGLGLAIAMEITQTLGEKLWVESEQGRGTAFYFTLQLRSESACREKTPLGAAAIGRRRRSPQT